jgi:cardiolipin synthase
MSRYSSKNRSVYTAHNKVELVRGGREYFDLLVKMIDNAEHSIHLQVYILEDDETGRLVVKALERAAARGIHVFMLVDGYASQGLSRDFIREIRKAGIDFRFFEPFLKSHNFYFGRRLHHKVVVVDAIYGMVGGLNIANRYNDMPGIDAWMDWGVFAEGEVAAYLFRICEELWKKSSRFIKHASYHVKLPDSLLKQECLVRVRRNDWVRKKNQISGSYIDMFQKATKQISIMSSYFLPGRVLRKKMEAASKRGIEIRLILAGNSDVTIVKYAERYIYRWIFKNKIRLFEYQKNVLHGKLSMYDDKWVTVGSYNVNFISAYASIELNLDIANEDFANNVKQTIDKIIQEDCVEVLEKEFESRYNFFQRVRHKFSYEIIQLVFFLFTFYFKPGKE